MGNYITQKNSKISYLELKTRQLFLLGIGLYLMIVLSFGILIPVAFVIWERFICKRKYINGRRLKFVGKIKDLFKKFIVWVILSIVTLGIYSIWAYINYYKWKIKHTVFEDSLDDSPVSKFTGGVWEYFLLRVISFGLCILTLGIAAPWAICIQSRWLATNTFINGEHLEYTGKGKGFIGYYFLWAFLICITSGIYTLWAFKNFLNWDTVNNRINNDKRVESLNLILTDFSKNNKVLFIPFTFQFSLIFLAMILMGAEMKRLEEYRNTEFVIEDGVLIVYNGDDSNVIIPSDVKKIGYRAFYGNRKIYTVILPEGITNIGTEAFAGCENLDTINIPDSITDIGVRAFAECYMLEEIDLSNRLYSIESETFLNCKNLRIVIVPRRVEIIKGDAFDGCLKVHLYAEAQSGESVRWDNNINNSIVTWGVEGVDVNFEYAYQVDWGDKIIILEYMGNGTTVVVPSEIEGKIVTKIGENAFYNNNTIKNITIPDTIVEIRDSAFEFSKIESIVLSKNLTRIGKRAFKDAGNLRNIVLPDRLLYINDNAFENCDNLININLPNSLLSLGEFAFSYCDQLESITIPKYINFVPRYAFAGCRNLSTVNFHEKLITIEEGAFIDCYFKSVDLPNSLLYIGASAFRECHLLESINIPEGVINIESRAFEDCIRLKEIIFPKKLLVLEERVFKGCSSLSAVIIPDTITKIENNAFSDCRNLSTVYIPESAKTIGSNVFSNTPNSKIYVEVSELLEGWDSSWAGYLSGTIVWNSIMPIE